MPTTHDSSARTGRARPLAGDAPVRPWLRPALVLGALAALPWLLALATRPPLAHLLVETAITLGLGGWILGLLDRERRASGRHALALARLSLTDPLTGLGTRAALERDLEPIVLRAGRATAPVALLHMDVDGLGQLNERYGRACGDDTLKQLGAVLRSSIRFGADAAYRLGGDAFVAVLTADAAAARIVAGRVTRTFAERSPRGSTLKAEVVAWDGQAKSFELLRAALAAAD